MVKRAPKCIYLARLGVAPPDLVLLMDEGWHHATPCMIQTGMKIRMHRGSVELGVRVPSPGQDRQGDSLSGFQPFMKVEKFRELWFHFLSRYLNLKTWQELTRTHLFTFTANLQSQSKVVKVTSVL